MAKAPIFHATSGGRTKRPFHPETTQVPIRLRKFIGAIALLTLVIVWALIAMALAQSALTDINGIVAAIYYAVVGLGWVLPAMPIVSWMSRPDKVKA